MNITNISSTKYLTQIPSREVIARDAHGIKGKVGSCMEMPVNRYGRRPATDDGISLKTTRAHYKHVEPAQSSLINVVMQETKQDFAYPWHYHPEIELTYILSGKGVRYVGNSMENFFENDLVLMGPSLPHCWINSPEHQLPASAAVAYLKPEFLDEAWMQSIEFESIRQLLELSRKGIRFNRSIALGVKQRMIALSSLPPFEKLMGLLVILRELAQTNSYHVLCPHGFEYDLNYAQNEKIKSVYKYVETHFREKISLVEISSQLNMTTETFSRFFSKIMKKSFFEFLNEYKINRACKLLIETDEQVTKVCYDAGFESIPFFYRQFKKFKNCQPKHYRSHYQRIV